MGESLVSFLDEGELDTSSGEETDDWFLAFTDNEHIVNSSGEMVLVGVLNVGNIEGTGVLLDVLENTYSTNIVTSNDQN